MTAFQRMIATFFIGLTLCMAGGMPLAVGAVGLDLRDANSFGAANIKPASAPTDLPALAAKVLNFILVFLGIIAVILVIVAGFQWMTAESEDKVKEARKRLVNSIAGLAIVALSWVIAWAIINSIAQITITK